MIGSLCSDLCFQFCALVFKAVCLFFLVLGSPWFMFFFCAPGFARLVLQFGLQNCWPSGVSTCQLCSQLCFFGLPALLFCASTSSFSGFQREREGEGESERDRRRGGEGAGERGRE